MIDLHLHTYYSDGRFSPAEVIQAAAERGMHIMAITDHDTIKGSREAAPLAAAAGLELIPAIEMTTRWPGSELPAEDANVDVLGYFIDPRDPVFAAFTDALLNDLHARITSCCARLTADGYALDLEDVLAENPRYGGAVPLIWAILHKGYAANWDAALELFNCAWEKMRETPFTIRSAIEQVHVAGGVAVLAHPSIVRPQGRQMTARWLRQLADWGLDGVEVYHRRLDREAREHFLGLAREFSLLVTGGSDMHGWGRGFNELGSQPILKEMVDLLRERRKRN